MKRYISILIVISSLLSLSGCGGIHTNFREIQQLLVIQTLGLDWEEGSIRVSMAAAAEASGSGPRRMSATGGTINTAIDRAYELSYEESIFFSHVNHILIGEAAAMEDMDGFLDYLCQSPELRIDIPLYIVREGTAEQAVMEVGDGSRGISEVMQAVAEIFATPSDSRVFTVADTISSLERYGSALVCAIRCEPGSESSGPQASGDSGGQEASGEQETKTPAGGEDSGTGMTMQTVVREINTEYESRLDEIKSSNPHDTLEMSGSRAVWKEVLAVYSVKTTTDPDNPQEVATMDETKKGLLTDIFWEMNEISSRTETKTETQVIESDDGHGNIVETETTVTHTYLYITVTHKTGWEMADQYGFDEEQREMLTELLADENNSLWSQVLYGITSGDGEIVSVALSQVGNVGGQPYWSWYGFGSRVEWCACFVSWCANESGYIDTGVIPKFAGCVLGSQWFMDRGQWQDGSFEPSAGHIIFFDWEGDGVTDHVGIVERVENGTVYTVEGNSGDSVRQNSYPIGSSVIYGYGIPAY